MGSFGFPGRRGLPAGTYVFELAVGGERQRLAPLHLIRDSGVN